MFKALDPSLYVFTFFCLPPFLVSAFILAIGLFVWVQHRASPSNRSFLLLCLAINLWLSGMALVYASRDSSLALSWYRGMAFLGVTLISPAVFTFSVHWLGLYEKQKRFVWGAFLGALLFYLLAFSTPYGMSSIRRQFWGYYPVYGPIGRIFLAFFFGYFFGAFYNFLSQSKQETFSLKRKQIRLIALAFLISLTGSVDYLSKISSVSLYPFGYLPVLTWILIVAYLIVRYRVMDIETVIHKTLMWGVTSLLFAAPLLGLSYWGKGWLLGLAPLGFSVVVFVAIALLVLYLRFFQPKIDHFFQRRKWDLTLAFEKFTDELVHLRDLKDLASHIVETVRNVFYVQEISLLLAREEQGPFEMLKSYPEAKFFRLNRSDPFLRWLERENVLVLKEYLDLDPKYHPIREAARSYFETTHAQVCVPLVLSSGLIGLLNIGQKANLRRFRAAEISFLSDLQKTAAIALSNSLRSITMQESLRRWNVELEKKVEERTKELKETQSQLIQAEKLASIGTLAGGIAHEINNPLTAVLTNVQMLKMLGEVEDKESLSLIEQGAKRCQNIIQKLMRYARKSEEEEGAVEEVDLNRVIQSVSDFLAYQLKQENVQLVTALAALPKITGIANELEQVFTNLILNARDAIRESGRPGGLIEIKTRQDNGFIQIEVKDNGKGIKKDHLARIFDPFYTTKDVGEGTGLGLTVSSGIVQKHGGKISVSSEEHQGTTFTIQFPNVKSKKPEKIQSEGLTKVG